MWRGWRSVSDDVHCCLAAGTAHQPQRLVIGRGTTVDEMQASQAWLASDTAVTMADWL